MIISTKQDRKISYMLLGLSWKLFDENREENFYGTDALLYEAEIHMIMFIKDFPGLHVSALAEKIGVTKGAVSQTVMKLVRKGMVEKVKDPQNHSRILLQLTSKGEIAYFEHKKYHQEFDRMVDTLMADASDDQIDFLKKFLNDLEQKIG